MRRHTSNALNRPWGQYDRFQKAHLLANALRASRGAPPEPPALQNSLVADVIHRVYRVSFTKLPLDNPDRAVRQIVDQKWEGTVPTAGVEFTIVAPGLCRQDDAIAIEERGADFNLIDADLRHVVGQAGVERAVLRWEPVHRTTSTWQLRTTTVLRNILRDMHPKASLLQYSTSSRRFYWNDFDHMFLTVQEDALGHWIVTTGFDALTEGLADLKPRWHTAMRALCETLPDQQNEIRRSRQDKLVAPWDVEDLQPAATLFATYHAMLKREGFFDLDRYRWYRRPKEQEV